jgi:hypothetical protein
MMEAGTKFSSSSVLLASLLSSNLWKGGVVYKNHGLPGLKYYIRLSKYLLELSSQVGYLLDGRKPRFNESAIRKSESNDSLCIDRGI